MSNPDLPYWIAFSRVPSVGYARTLLLERHFTTMHRAWEATAAELRAAGLDQSVVNAIVTVRSRVEPQAEMEMLEHAGAQAVTMRDPAYPELLREVHDAPPVLFYKGTLLPGDSRAVTVIGTRQATAYGREVTRHLTGDLARQGVTILSGLARGIDAVAHKTAIDAGGRTLAVMGSGIDVIYPPEHAQLAREITEHGAIISEYPLGTKPEARHFPRRNRLLSGMSLGTLVVEAGEGSGALWTVQHALEQNREVFCVPGSIYSPASKMTNALIQEGAKLVVDVGDILEELNLSAVTATQQELPGLAAGATPEERTLLGVLTMEPVHIDDLSRQSQLPVTIVTGTLAMMELKGMVRQVGAMNYMKTREAAAAYDVAPR